jgi:predicted DNA-binding protein YlxM (UPF0122 family)
MSAYNYKDKEWLYNKYWEENLSLREIANLCKVDKGSIVRFFHKFNLPRRTLSESHSGKLHHNYGKHLSDVIRKKISSSLKGKEQPWNQRDNHPFWNGGKFKHHKYIYILLDKDNPFYCMAKKNKGYIAEHRYIMANYLGRPLESWEIVHHIDGNKTNNKISNLKLFSKSTHDMVTILEEENRKLKEEIKILKQKIHATI